MALALALALALACSIHKVILISEEFIGDAITCLEEELVKELSEKEVEVRSRAMTPYTATTTSAPTNTTKMVPKWSQNGPKIVPKLSLHQSYRGTFEKAENKLHRTLDYNVDKAEMYSMRNIFHVPSQIYPAWCAKQAGDDAATDWSDSVATTDASLRATAKVTREEEDELTLKLKEARRAVRLGRREKAANTEQVRIGPGSGQIASVPGAWAPTLVYLLAS